ncbi:HPP family protein [uncultured Xylophilus sp.]|uniref:HPP family protein n=1 Tax=uncultured Xylophilus sp. TaxID=296832 RepID=UPI0025FF041F|nr:HPP family protein [uncultured Xylophilus sp.]
MAAPAAARWTAALRDWCAALRPEAPQVSQAERWRIVAGAALGVLVAGIAGRWFGADAAAAWLVAPMGASAVLVFAVPASPMAQPWAVVGGNTLSALVGIACARWIGEPLVAAPAAVGLAIAAMFLLRCLHPPGGASALLMVLAHETRWGFAAHPVLLDSLALAAAGMLFHHLTGRAYPPRRAAPAPGASATTAERFSAADLDAALAHYDGVIDVSRADLATLLHHAETAAYQRTWGELRCRDIMSREVVTVQFGTSLQEAWTLMRERRIKALPVTDRARRVTGIVTTADFMREVGLERPAGLLDRLRALVQPSPGTTSDKPETVGQIMTRTVRVASQDRHAMELVPLFSEGGHHHIPVIDHEHRLVGIITQSDLVRALYRGLRPG